MVTRVLVIGGYGNFGGYISRSLGGEPGIALIVGGRSAQKAMAFAQMHGGEGVALDIHVDLERQLRAIAPDFVIHTTGPFQNQSYAVAQACIAVGAHYCDLADARSFVTGIGALDDAARAASVQIVSGASSVPCLTAAIIDHYAARFFRLESVRMGISAAQQTNRGLATTSAILSYVGKPFAALEDGAAHRVFGWQGIHSVSYPQLGRRWFGHCDIPDLMLFPDRYAGLRHLDFSAGHEIALLHWSTWGLS